MTVKSNWWDILKRAWSIRLLLVAGFLSGLEVALPLMDGWVDIPRGLFAILSFLATAGAMVARVLTQRNLAG